MHIFSLRKILSFLCNRVLVLPFPLLHFHWSVHQNDSTLAYLLLRVIFTTASPSRFPVTRTRPKFSTDTPHPYHYRRLLLRHPFFCVGIVRVNISIALLPSSSIFPLHLHLHIDRNPFFFENLGQRLDLLAVLRFTITLHYAFKIASTLLYLRPVSGSCVGRPNPGSLGSVI